MNTLLVLLLLVSLIAMVVGLVKPGLVVRWGAKKTRMMALMIYGGLVAVISIALVMTGTPADNAHKDETTQIEQPQKAARKVTADKEKFDKASK